MQLIALVKFIYLFITVFYLYFLLARPIGQYCFARCRLSSSVTLPEGRARGRPTLHGGPVVLRPVRATPGIYLSCCHILVTKQGVAITGRNRTGPPSSVGRPIVHTAGPAAANRSRARRPVGPPAGSATDDDRRQTPASKTILAH